MNFILKSNRNVRLKALHLISSYGTLIGFPSARINRNIIENASYPIEWGERKVLFLEPDIKEIESELDPIQYCVWLDSEPLKEKILNSGYTDGSELVVIWFGEKPAGEPIINVIGKYLSEIDWDRYAENFDY